MSWKGQYKEIVKVFWDDCDTCRFEKRLRRIPKNERKPKDYSGKRNQRSQGVWSIENKEAQKDDDNQGYA